MSIDRELLERMNKVGRFLQAVMLEREAYRLTLAECGAEGWEHNFDSHLSDPNLQAFAKKAVTPFMECIQHAVEAAEILDRAFPGSEA